MGHGGDPVADFASAEEQTFKQTGTIGQSVGFMATSPTIALLSTAAHLSPHTGADHTRLSHRWLSTQRGQSLQSFKGSYAVSCAGVVREKARRDKSGAALRMVECGGRKRGCELRLQALSLSPELVRVPMDALQLRRQPAACFSSLLTTQSASAQTVSKDGGRMEREDDTPGPSAQPPVVGNHVPDEALWSMTSQETPFLRQTSSG